MSERELMLAVIQRAIEDSKIDPVAIRDKDKETAEREKKYSLGWLFSDSEDERSFCWYCRLVGLDPQWVRAKLNLILKGEERWGKKI